MINSMIKIPPLSRDRGGTVTKHYRTLAALKFTKKRENTELKTCRKETCFWMRKYEEEGYDHYQKVKQSCTINNKPADLEISN